MTEDANRPLAVAAAALLTLVVGVLLVIGRDHFESEITVLVLALTVVIAARFGSRPGGIAAAAMAATTFDFFHTKPYLSLKISSGDDIAVTFVLLAVGLVAGDLSARAARDRRVLSTRELDADAISRLLAVAGDKSFGELEFAVKTELTELLTLRDCWFTLDAVDQPELGANGSVPGANVVYRDEGFELPEDGVSIPVTAKGARLGSLVCLPVPHVGIGITRRKTAVVAAHVLGLAMVADPRSTRRTPRKP